jgi:hypothetical protein
MEDALVPEEEQRVEFLPGIETVDQFAQGLFENLIKGTKQANQLPGEKDYKYYSSFKPFRNSMKELGGQALSIIQSFLYFEQGDKVSAIANSLNNYHRHHY